MDVVAVEFARLNQMLDLRDGDARGGRHHRIKIARGLAVDEIALGIALPGVHEREVGDEAGLHDVALAVELALFLALGDVGADAGLGEEGRNAGAARAHALGQRALRVELDLQLAGEELLREQLVLAHIRGDHLLDLPRFEQQAEPGAVDAGIVRHAGQVLHAGVAQRLDQGFRHAAQAEPAGHDHHAVLQDAVERRLGVGIDLFHWKNPPPKDPYAA